jgi:putative ABC transport system permease protein
MTLAGLAARNLLRNRFRTILTVLGVAVAVLSFVTIRTVVQSWTVAAEVAPKDRIVTRHKVTFIMPLPKRYVEQVRQVPGVKATTFATWFGGRDPKNEREFFSTLAAQKETIFQVYSEMVVPPEQLEAWKQDRSGAVVGDALAGKMGWKVGDRVTLESGIYQPIDGVPWTFTVRGIYTASAKSVDRSTFMFHWDLLNERVPDAMKDHVGWIISRVDDPTRAADYSVQIDKRFEEQEVQTLSQDERSFNASFMAGFSAVLKALDIVSAVILVIMGLVLGNTIAMGVRERTHEYGAMRALGFRPGHLFGFVVGESVVTGLVGAVFGALLCYPLIERGMGRWLEENMGAFFPFFRIDTLTLATAFGLVTLLSVLASLVPALAAARLKVTDALRRVQ